MKSSEAFIGKDGLKRIPYVTDQNNPTVKEYVAAVKKDWPHDKLVSALYWIYDAFDRANMGYFFVYSTAESILQQKDLEGDGIHVGVRFNEWTSGSKPIFDAFAGEPVVKSNIKAETLKNIMNDIYIYDHEGIPVFLYVFNDHPCIIDTNQIQYRNEFVRLPNPYSQFMDTFGATWKSQ